MFAPSRGGPGGVIDKIPLQGEGWGGVIDKIPLQRDGRGEVIGQILLQGEDSSLLYFNREGHCTRRGSR